MSILTSQDHYETAVRRFKSTPIYPNNYKTWQQFCNSMQVGVGPECYFALTLMDEPPKLQGGVMPFWSSPDHVVFGVLTNRDDGKFGRLCVAREWSANSCPKITRFDGFDRDALRLPWVMTEEGLEGFDRGAGASRKITNIFFEKARVEELFVDWLGFFVRDGTDVTPSYEEAQHLEELRVFLQMFFPSKSQTKTNIAISNHQLIINLRIGKYLNSLRDEIEMKNAEIRELRKRLKQFP